MAFGYRRTISVSNLASSFLVSSSFFALILFKTASKLAWSVLKALASSPILRMVMELILSPFSILFTTSMPLMTFPKTVCLLSSQEVALWVIKNWLPLVPGPALAIERIPGQSCLSPSTNSSGNWYPGPPLPVPVGSPPWIIKFFITL